MPVQYKMIIVIKTKLILKVDNSLCLFFSADQVHPEVPPPPMHTHTDIKLEAHKAFWDMQDFQRTG